VLLSPAPPPSAAEGGGKFNSNAFPPSLATTTVVGGVLLADSTAITNGTAGRVVDAAQLKAGLDPKATTSALAMVATTGSYVDLLNTPSDFDGGNF
jgi:hypothetical protein